VPFLDVCQKGQISLTLQKKTKFPWKFTEGINFPDTADTLPDRVWMILGKGVAATETVNENTVILVIECESISLTPNSDSSADKRESNTPSQ